VICQSAEGILREVFGSNPPVRDKVIESLRVGGMSEKSLCNTFFPQQLSLFTSADQGLFKKHSCLKTSVTVAADEIIAALADVLQSGLNFIETMLHLTAILRSDCAYVWKQEKIPGIAEFIEHSDIGILQIILTNFALRA
jgi:hypothetical protein